MSGGGVCGKRWGYAEVSMGTGANLGESMRKWLGRVELLLPGAGCPGLLSDVRCAGCPVDSGRMSGLWIGDEHDELHGKNCNSGAKFGRNGGWKSRERWGKSRSTRCKADPWIKSNKTSSHQQITKKNWGYFWWGFSDLGRKQQNQARTHGVAAPKT